MMNESTPTPERRRSRRRQPRGSVRVYLRLGGLDLGPNLALSLLDLSEGGAALGVNAAMEPGQVVSIGLEAQTQPRPILRTANVVWCRPAADGTYAVGVAFQKDLPYRAYNDLTQPIGEAEQYHLNLGPTPCRPAENPEGAVKDDAQKTTNESPGA